MMNSVADKQLKRLSSQLLDLFTIDSTYQQAGQLTMHLSFKYEHERSRKLIEDRLKLAGYDFKLEPSATGLILKIDPKPKLRIPRLNIILFLVTIASVYFVGVSMFSFGGGSFLDDFMRGVRAGNGLIFTAAIMSILLVHEMGHFVASRRRGIVTSWPYFIPAPSIIGTFGAVIKSKSPFWNRRDLIEVGAAGPIAGWIVAIVWLVWGLNHSSILYPWTQGESAMIFSLEGESILIKWLVPSLIGSGIGQIGYSFSEAAFAGWVGLFITSINMLPIGQLDGGHIIYGLVPRQQLPLGLIALSILFWMGFYYPGWWLFGGLTLILRVKHPPTMEDYRKPSRSAVLMGVVALVIFAVSLTPIPFR